MPAATWAVQWLAPASFLLPALEKVPVSCLGLCGGWELSQASTSLFILCGCHLWRRRRRYERGVSWWLGTICTMTMSWASSKTIEGADTIPPLPTLFWLFILWWHNIRNKNKIWPELEFLHLLLFTHVTAMLEEKYGPLTSEGRDEASNGNWCEMAWGWDVWGW